MKNQTKYRLGLDIGTNSLGWSVLKIGEKGKIEGIENAGVRIFSDGRGPKSKATLAADRRMARGASRRRDRFLQRQHSLIVALTEAGLFPEDRDEREKLQLLNPLQLRARALSEKLTPHQIGRALFHINQRRGFKSNRKDKSEDTRSGKVADSVKELAKAMGLVGQNAEEEVQDDWWKKLGKNSQLSYGAFLWQRHKKRESTRARPGAGEKGDLYDVYPTRAIYKDEFGKIWAKQAEYHPGVMTVELKEKMCGIIFDQRELKPQERGRCMYMQSEKRTFRAMPSFQRYRICQEVNNLKWYDENHREWKSLRAHKEARDKIVDMLERGKRVKNPSVRNAEIGFGALKKCLANEGLVENTAVGINYETFDRRKGLDANLTSHIMQRPDHVGEQWHGWSLDKQDKFVALILDSDELSDEEVKEKLQSEYGLPALAADKCVSAGLVEGTASISCKAARLMLDKMQEAVGADGEVFLPLQHKAAEMVEEEVAEFTNPMRKQGEAKELRDELPYYGKVFDGRHIIPGSRNPDDEGDDLKYYGGVTNPTVHIALNQIRQVVNELIGRYGLPYSIAIELARELPEGAKYRAGLSKAQEENQKKNRELGDELPKGIQNNAPNRLRLKLWKEQGKHCPYSGKKIGFAELFTAEMEIDHIIPFSISLDDSAANKVVCTRKANRDKKDRTPYDAFHNSPNGYKWDDILKRAGDIKITAQQFNRAPKDPAKRSWKESEFNNKLWRFQEDALDRLGKESGEFLARHLNDTRYIGRLAKEYLEHICHIDRIDVLTGRLTSILRGHWGLNRILNPEDRDAKNRDDHRHHAVDAIVIGMTDKGMLQKVATEHKRGRDVEKIQHLFPKNKDGTSAIDPWPGFRGDAISAIRAIKVSHRTNHKKQGQLHKETAYGFVNKEDVADKFSKATVVFRKSISAFTEKKHVQEIRSKTLRSDFVRAFDVKGKEGVQSLAEERDIRHLRVWMKKSVQPMKDRGGKIYKGYELRNNWALEIYQRPDSDKWEEVIVSLYQAAKKDFRPGFTCRPHPAARLIMRIFNDDMLEITDEQGESRLMRVQKMSKGIIEICEHQLANVAESERTRQLVDSQLYYRCTVSTLQKFQARKVHISPTGLIRRECRKPRVRKK